MPIRVFVVADRGPVCRFFESLLEREPDMALAGIASPSDPDVAVAVPEATDVALVEFAQDGIEACRQIRSKSPEVRVLLVCTVSPDEAALATSLAGADGWVGWRDDGEQAQTIRKLVASGSVPQPVPPDPIVRLGIERLGDRERTLFELVSEGHSNREIAEKLGLPETTVSNRVSFLSSKLGLVAPRTTTPDPPPSAPNPHTVEAMLAEFAAQGSPAKAKRTTGQWDPLYQLALCDPHTGLANRMLVLDRLSQAMARKQRNGAEVVVYKITLENFDDINNQHGHAIGTAVIADIGRRLTTTLRAEDTVGRISSDRLVTVVSVNGEPAVELLTRRIRQALEESSMIDGRKIRVRSTIHASIAEGSRAIEDLDRWLGSDPPPDTSFD